jgi:hypothetical protein
LGKVDAESLPWLKKVIAEAGRPGQSIVGDDRASDAWLLVQHADTAPGETDPNTVTAWTAAVHQALVIVISALS